MFEFFPKKFLRGTESMDKLLDGAREVAEIVGSTMGPHGQLVMYEESEKNPYPTTTKDGVSVAKMISFADQSKNMASAFCIQAAQRQVYETGDGTTLTTVLVYAILKEANRLVIAGINKNDIVKNITRMINCAIDHIKSSAITDVTLDKLKFLATISANGDTELGALIAEAVHKTGKFGMVFKGKSFDGEHRVEYQDGYPLDIGITLNEFVDGPNHTCSIRDAHVLVTDQDIFYPAKLQNILNHVMNNTVENTEPTLVIVAPSMSDSMLKVLTKNAQDKERKIRIVWVLPSPDLQPIKNKFLMEDISSLTGAKFVSKSSGLMIESVTPDYIGRIQNISQNAERTLFSNYDPTNVKQRVGFLKDLLDETKDEQMKSYCKDSIARLECGVARIFVSAPTTTEQQEILDRVDDAIHTCKSSLELGYVRGGGVELIHAIDAINETNTAYKTAIKNILTAPAKTILQNAQRDDWQMIINEVLFGCNGYAINNHDYPDMLDIGVIDPAKVLTYALKNALSASISMFKTNTMMIHDIDGMNKLRQAEGH